MKIKVAQVVGLNTDQRAAQVFSEQREEETFLAVVNLSCDDAFTKGRLALSELSDFYFDTDGNTSEKLNKTFQESSNKFEADPNFDLVLGSISGKILYLIGKGQVEVYLRRSEKLSPLLSIGSEKQIISGFLQEGDRILLSTKSLTAFLGDNLEESLALPLDTFEEEISSKIAQHPLPDSEKLDSKDQEEKAAEESEEQEVEEKNEEKDVQESQISPEGLAGLAIDIHSDIEEENIPSLPKEEVLEEYPSQEEPVYSQEREGKNILGNLGNIFKKIASYFPKSGRTRLILALILILIIGGGIGFQYKRSKDKQRLAQFNQELQEAKDEFAAAKGLSSLSPTDAKAKLDSAKSKINLALNLYPNNQEAKDLQKQMNDESSSILQESQTKDFPVFLDLDLVKKNFRASQMSLSAGKLLILDPTQDSLITIDISKKSNQIQAGSDQLGDASLVSLNGGLGFVYSKDKGILRVDITNQKVTSVAKVDKDWGAISDLYGFGSNIYVLDSGKNQIWKYVPTTDGYSDKREYLNKDTKADFSNALRMQIESSIYILKKGGEILRFTKGDKDNFSLAGLDKGVKDPKSLFVSSDTDNLYLLDSGNSRVLILTKTGTYKGQISGDKFSSATDLVVDEKEKKVYLLDGSKIYAVDLK